MAQAKIEGLLTQWKEKSGKLELTSDQETKIKQWFADCVEKLKQRKEGARKVIGDLKTAVDGGDDKAAEENLQKLREGLRQHDQGREKALDEFDQILKPNQRARIVLFAVSEAKAKGQSVEHLLDSILSGVAE
ncbi:unnamed protein product [Didymodactylos carnosus]|nr:unnamed protein product [Didymodactylos carnosus]CAF3909806.1 unnamed protein product [Didymodactylos carnosus]